MTPPKIDAETQHLVNDARAEAAGNARAEAFAEARTAATAAHGAMLAEHEKLDRLLTARHQLDSLFHGPSLLQSAEPVDEEHFERAVDAFDAWGDRFADEWEPVIGKDRADAFRLTDEHLVDDEAIAAAHAERVHMIEQLRQDAELFPYLMERMRA